MGETNERTDDGSVECRRGLYENSLEGTAGVLGIRESIDGRFEKVAWNAGTNVSAVGIWRRMDKSNSDMGEFYQAFEVVSEEAK